MSKFKIPNQGQVRQLNINDTFGELWSSFNIDLHTNPGKIKLARPMKRVATASDLSNERVVGFAALSSASGATTAYAITDTDLYQSLNPYTSWSAYPDVDIDVQAAEDIVVFKGQLIITATNNLDAYDPSGSGTWTSNWWTARGNPTLTSNNPVSQVPRVMEVVRIGAEELVVLDGSNIYGYTGGITSGAITNVTMDIDVSMVATCVKSGIRNVWIGTYTTESTEAYVYQWDGASTNYSQSYPVGSKSVLAIELDDDVPVIITERGEIKKFNNVGFSTIAQFPFTGKPLSPEGFLQATNFVRPIHPKGIKRVGRNLYIAVVWDDSLPIDERTPAGIWVCNLDTGSLTHLASPDNESVFTNASPLMYLNSDAGRLFSAFEKNADSNEEGIWIEDLDNTSENHGYFVTSEIESDSVKDVFESIITKAVMDDDNELIVKYRTSKIIDYPVTVSGNWYSANQFNTTSDLSFVKSRFDAGHFDEIETLIGTGAGRLAHITSIEESDTVYQVTIDEEVGTADDPVTVRFDNWKKIPATFTNTDGEMKRLGIGSPGTWAQFKVALKGKAGYPEVRSVTINSNTKEQ